MRSLPLALKSGLLKYKLGATCALYGVTWEKKQELLTQLLASLGHSVTFGSLEYPTAHAAQTSEYSQEILRIYKQLGGVQSMLPLRLRSWDIEINAIAVELDEQLHFNQYRAITLESSVYKSLPKFPLQEYKSYCQEREEHCRKAGWYGGKWTNPSCEKQFGKAGPNGVLSGNGSPRWKQRAFYDFVKDLSPFLIGVKVVRISVWDAVIFEDRTLLVKDALYSPEHDVRKAVYELILGRV